MSGLAALLAGRNQPGTYQWHNAAHVDDIRHAVEHAGWRFVYLDGWTFEDRETFLKATAAAFECADHPGQDFSALAECLSRISADGDGGIVVLWDGWSPFARAERESFDGVLDVLSDRVRAKDGGRFAVLMRGEGPEIDVPELLEAH